VISDSFSRIVSPHSGQSFPAIDISLDGPYGTNSSMHGHTFRPFNGGMLTAAPDDARQDDGSCFADEVIVDFPSVAPALDRMRHAFLSVEQGMPFQTAIQLSARDALEGVTVPLSVRVGRTCHDCGGRGESWTSACRRCDGSGTELVPHQLQVTIPAGVVDGTSISFTVAPPHNPPTRIQLRIAVA